MGKGSQLNHGKNSPESVGGPGKKARCNAKVIPAFGNPS